MPSFMVEVGKSGGGVVIARKWEIDKEVTLTFGDHFSMLTNNQFDEYRVEAKIGVKKPESDPCQFVKIDLHAQLRVIELQGGNFVRYTILPPIQQDDEEDRTSEKDTLKDMMQRARVGVLPKPVNENTMKDKLFNDILKLIAQLEESVGFGPECAETTGRNFVQFLTDMLWYLDPFWLTLEERSVHMPQLFMKLYQERRKGHAVFKMYNDYQVKKKTKPSLSTQDLQRFVDVATEYINTVWLAKPQWGQLHSALSQLVLGGNKYLSYMKDKAAAVAKLHKSSTPARTPIEDAQTFYLPVAGAIPPIFNDIDKMLKDAEICEPICLNDLDLIAQKNPDQKFKFIEKLKITGLSIPAVLMKYSPFGAMFTFCFVWKVAETADQVEREKYGEMERKVILGISRNIPVFHTRMMKREFQLHFSLLGPNIQPAVYREMYSFLTGDASKSATKTSQAVDERMKLALASGDPNLVVDLREHNTGRREKYNPFWDALHRLLEMEYPAAANERRHGAQCYLPVAVSIRDLIEKVKELEPGIAVPSETWVRFQFWPKDATSHAALNYTGRFQMKYRVQSRSLHKDHEDSHYCMALYKYMRCFAVMYREHVLFHCMDDKHGISIGEPEAPIASLDRGKRVIVFVGKEPVALDHDFHRFKLTPSVTLVPEVPEKADDSFYQGQVFVSLKDSVLQPSNPLRHMAELKLSLASGNPELLQKPIEVGMSDGGPDHNVRHGSVKVSLVAHALDFNLDMLVAGITAPGGSWINPAERIMSILNLGLYGVSLARSTMPDEMEKAISSCSSMSDLRLAASKREGLHDALIASLHEVKETTSKRFMRLKLKANNFKVIPPASQFSIDDLFSCLKAVDESINVTDTTKKDLEKRKDFAAFMSSHTRQRQYMFQYKKCDNALASPSLKQEAQTLIEESDAPEHMKTKLLETIGEAKTWKGLGNLVEISRANDMAEVEKVCTDVMSINPCEICLPPRLPLKLFAALHWVPDPQYTNPLLKAKYQAFADLYGKDTDEVARPGTKEDKDKEHKQLLTKEKVRSKIACVVCNKVRVIYSDKRLWNEHQVLLEAQKDDILYSCGSPLFPDDHDLHHRIVVRQSLRCDDAMEFQYFSSKLFPVVCVWCSQEFTEPHDHDLSREYKTVLHACQGCMANGKYHITRGPIKMKKKK